jgi:hypothetical protein
MVSHGPSHVAGSGLNVNNRSLSISGTSTLLRLPLLLLGLSTRLTDLCIWACDSFLCIRLISFSIRLLRVRSFTGWSTLESFVSTLASAKAVR